MLNEKPPALDSSRMAESIWEAAAQQFGEVNFEGIKIPVTLETYSMAKQAQQLEDLQKARQSGHRINHSAAATDLFTAGLAMVGGQLRDGGVSFDEWAVTCRRLVDVFKGSIEPVANQLDGGLGPEKVTIELFTSAVRHHFEVTLGMGRLIEFLNSR